MNPIIIDKTISSLLKLNPQHCQLRLLLTNSCPHQCSWCHMEGDDRGSTFIKVELFESIISLFSAEQRRSITLVLSGGEPLIHPEIKYFVEEAKKVGFQAVHMVTNGHNPKLLQELAPYLDIIKIHLESYDDTFYRYIHKVSIDNVQRAISLLSVGHSHKVLVESPINRLEDIQTLLDINSMRGLTTKMLEIKPEDGLSYPSFNSIVKEVCSAGYDRVSNHDDFTHTYVKDSHVVYVSQKCNSESTEDIFVNSSGFVYQSLGSGKPNLNLQAA